LKDLSPGFPKQKGKKKKKFPGMSEKNTERMPERKEVIDATHKRSNYRCEAAWIAPEVPCSRVLDADERVPRSGGGSPLDKGNTQSLCRKDHTVKGLEVKAAEILGLYGEKRKNKHFPITEEDYEEAISRFTEAKKRLYFY
jgi:hypothetical protein